MGRRVIDSCHGAIWARLDHFCGIYGAWSADRWASGSPALCFSLGEANRQNVKFAKMDRVCYFIYIVHDKGFSPY